MKISEIIKKLEQLKAQHGDLEVRSFNWRSVDTVELREAQINDEKEKFVQVV